MAGVCASRLRALGAQVASLEDRVGRVARLRPAPARPGDTGLSAMERIARVLDPDGPWFEIGALRGHDRHDGAAGAGGLLTGVGTVGGEPVVIVASVPAAGGRWWPVTVDKLIRAQEVALRHRLPIGYLLEGTVPAPDLEDGHFPGCYGPSRVLTFATVLRRRGVLQVAGRFGSLWGAGALLAELADHAVSIGLTGLELVREFFAGTVPAPRVAPGRRPARAPTDLTEALDDVLPADHRRSYDMHAVLRGLLDGGELTEFQPRNAAEMLCGHGWIEGIPVAVIANRRGLVPVPGASPRVGGIIYTGSATKTGYFIETASRQGIPILFLQDVSGFMLGVEAEHSGIIRAGAGLVEAMATARSARITLTINHASGAGYYAMASQGFDPDFTLAWPTGRIGAMEAEAAINAVHGTKMNGSGKGGAAGSAAVKASMADMRATFERDLDAVHAAARGHVDAIVRPASTRATLAFLLQITARPWRHPDPEVR